MPPHVDDADRGLSPGADAGRHRQAAVATRAHVLQALQRRRRRGEQHGHAEALRAHDGEVAGRVPEAALLLERRVVLLVDDDQAGGGQRREHGRAGPDDEARRAARGGQPRREPLALGQARMQHGDAVPETPLEPADELRREADLRHEEQRLPAARELLGDEPQVDFRLAAAGHPVQQPGREASGRADVGENAVLVAGELDGMLWARCARGGPGRSDDAALEAHPALRDKPANRVGRDPRGGEIGAAPRPAAEQAEQLRLLWSAARRRVGVDRRSGPRQRHERLPRARQRPRAARAAGSAWLKTSPIGW